MSLKTFFDRNWPADIWAMVGSYTLPLLVLLLFSCGVGGLLGRASVQKVDTTRADSLEVTKEAHDALRDTLRTVVDSLTREAREDSARAAHAAHVAASAQAAGRRARDLAGALAEQLDSARSAGDSVPILVQVNARLSQAVDSLSVAADSFSIAYQREQQVSARFRVAIGRLEDQVTRDSVRLEVYQSVVDGLKRAQAGCRIPLVKVKCPVIGPGYSAALIGGKVQHGISLSVVYPLLP